MIGPPNHETNGNKNTTRIRANTFGFYAIKGHNTIYFKEHFKKEDITEFIKQIRVITLMDG